MQKSMSLQTIALYVKSEDEWGVQTGFTTYPDGVHKKLDGAFGVPLTGGGISHNPEHSDSAVITDDLMKLPSVVTKVTSNAAINLEASGHRIFLDLTAASMYSDSSYTTWRTHRFSKTVSVTISSVMDAVLGINLTKITAPAGTFGTAGLAPKDDLDRVVRKQWINLDGFTGIDLLDNNTWVQVARYVSDTEVLVFQPLEDNGGVAVPNITISGGMIRNGIPKKTMSKDNANAWQVVGDKHPSFTMAQDYYGAEEKFALYTQGAVPESWSLTVNANSIITATCNLICMDTRRYEYTDATPFIVNDIQYRSYPSISSAAETQVYVDGVPFCVKDFSINLNGLAEAIFCVGKLGASGGTFNAIVPEVKATEYLGKSNASLRAIYDYDTKSWTPRDYSVHFADILGNKFAFTAYNCAMTGEIPGPGTGTAELSLSGKAGRYVDIDILSVAMGGTGKLTATANAIEKIPYVMQLDYVKVA